MTTPGTTLWFDASSGASGDMLLGALVGAGVPVETVQAAVDAVSPEPVALRVEAVTRNGFAATRVHVDVSDSVEHRSWRDIRTLLLESDLADEVRDLALRVFERLAVAEGAVHGHDPLDVHFHEVGALDAIADVVGVCAGIAHLAPAEIVVTPIAVGSGTVRGAHGTLPVPPPAVAALLTGVPSYAGPEGAPATELCTPTGAALLTTLATSYGAATGDDHAAGRRGRRRPGPRGARQRAAAAGRHPDRCPRRRRTTCWSSRPTWTTSTRGCGPRSSPPSSLRAPSTPG